MKFPMALHVSMTKYLMRHRSDERYPLVLMLEPTHKCNLNCPGCGRIREYKDTLDKELTLEECIQSVDECPAPVVTVTGGEPLMYSQVGPLVREILKRDRHVYFCTNGLLLERSVDKFEPTSRFNFNVHLDGPEDIYEEILGIKGAYQRVINGIKAAKERGFRVTTNTTVYLETQPEQIDRLFAHLTEVGVDGILIAPAYHYEAVEEGLFLTRDEIVRKFREIEPILKKYNILSTPMYMDFLMGKREMQCTPWGNPTRNPKGWKAPCYLITDTHYPTYKELMEKTDWDRFVSGEDPRCEHCMMHCGYEPTVVRELSGMDIFRMLIWNLR